MINGSLVYVSVCVSCLAVQLRTSYLTGLPVFKYWVLYRGKLYALQQFAHIHFLKHTLFSSLDQTVQADHDCSAIWSNVFTRGFFNYHYLVSECALVNWVLTHHSLVQFNFLNSFTFHIQYCSLFSFFPFYALYMVVSFYRNKLSFFQLILLSYDLGALHLRQCIPFLVFTKHCLLINAVCLCAGKKHCTK